MTKSQIFAFLKAPLERSCFVAYLFILPFFLAVPFSLDIIQKLPIQGSSFPSELFQTPHFITALIGVLFGLFLIAGFGYALAHQLTQQSQSPFDISIPHLSFSQICKGCFCAITWTLCCILYIFLAVMIVALIPVSVFFVSHYLPTFINVLLWIATIPTVLMLFVLMILNFFIATFTFLQTLRVTTCFEIARNYRYLKQNKSNILRASLFTFVLSQVVNLLLSNILSKLTSFGVQNFTNNSHPILWTGIIAAGALFYVYITLLNMMILAKITVWISASPDSEKH